MKREFLQNLKVGDQPLSKEIIDAIMDEHSRSVGAIRAQLDAANSQLQTAKDGLKAFEGVDVKDLQGQIAKLQGDLTAKDAAHQKELADMAFNRILDGAITAAKGKNAKAITALLDVETLRGSKNQEADIKAALEGLKKDSGYLFDDEAAPPPYSPGAGSGSLYGKYDSQTNAIRAAAGLKTE